MKWACLLLGLVASLQARLIDLEERAQDFVLETKKIEIPGYPYAFNPSIIRWGEGFLMSFRIIPDLKNPYTSRLGLIWLDSQFNPISEPQLLETRNRTSVSPSRAEDGRLIFVGERLYLIYSDNIEAQISRGGFRMYIAEVREKNGRLFIEEPESLLHFEGETREKREKNWVPFDYQGNLMLAYSILPHRIFHPLLERQCCETFAVTEAPIRWRWGEVRGGTPGLLVDGEYLAFFHSCKKISTVHSEGNPVLHYFMGAYTFKPYPPFSITRISREPIVGKKFYKGPIYRPYWGSVRVVFPAGFVFDENYVWIAYGRQDHEVWIAKLHKKALLENLTPLPD
jgi:predicted GH43/DUF377 family glycosyl hydrolase